MKGASCKRKTIFVPDQLTRNCAEIIAETRSLLDAIESGRKRLKRDSLSEPLVELLMGNVRDRKPWLNVPMGVVKKILMYLDATECWRIASRLSKGYNKWVKGIVHLVYFKLSKKMSIGWYRKTEYAQAMMYESDNYAIFTIRGRIVKKEYKVTAHYSRTRDNMAWYLRDSKRSEPLLWKSSTSKKAVVRSTDDAKPNDLLWKIKVTF